MEHTAGPWKQLTDDNGDVWVIADDGHRYHIANMEGSCGTCHANANLIAAAPDLLAVCEEVEKTLSDFGIFDKASGLDNTLLGRARAAIAKAKGD
jgi:hypothetical protein